MFLLEEDGFEKFKQFCKFGKNYEFDKFNFLASLGKMTMLTVSHTMMKCGLNRPTLFEWVPPSCHFDKFELFPVWGNLCSYFLSASLNINGILRSGEHGNALHQKCCKIMTMK